MRRFSAPSGRGIHGQRCRRLNCCLVNHLMSSNISKKNVFQLSELSTCKFDSWYAIIKRGKTNRKKDLNRLGCISIYKQLSPPVRPPLTEPGRTGGTSLAVLSPPWFHNHALIKFPRAKHISTGAKEQCGKST